MAAIGLIPIGDVIFGKKGAIPQLISPDDKVVDAIHETAKSAAHTFFHIPSISEWLGVRGKIEDIAVEMHNQALLTPDPTDDKINYLQHMYAYADKAPLMKFMPLWVKDISLYIMSMFNQVTHNSVQFVFSHVYRFVTEIVLFTPEWIFDNSWFPVAISKYSTLSIGLVTAFTMIEGIKRMLKLSHTPFRETMKKFPIALGISAACPYIFSNGLKLLNKLTKMIINLSAETISDTSNSVSFFATSLVFEPINILIMLLFLVITAFLCVPMIMLHAKRWFDLMVLGTLTPLCMSAWLFHSTEKYFHVWLKGIKNLSLVQLAYAVFISILGILLFATPNPTTFIGILTKTMLAVGGLHRMAFLPSFLKSFDDRSGGMRKFYSQVNEYKDDKVEKVKTMGKTSEKVLITGSKFAGKAFRFFFKA